MMMNEHLKRSSVAGDVSATVRRLRRDDMSVAIGCVTGVGAGRVVRKVNAAFRGRVESCRRARQRRRHTALFTDHLFITVNTVSFLNHYQVNVIFLLRVFSLS